MKTPVFYIIIKIGTKMMEKYPTGTYCYEYKSTVEEAIKDEKNK